MSLTTRKAAALVLALSLGAAACASDDSEAITETTVSDTAEESTDDAMEEVGTIVDVAVANGSFTTLVAAVQAADLVDTLNSEGPFTVFAPTDDAFAAALEALDMTAEELLADTETLTTILTYHVIPGAVASGDLSDGMMAATVQGEEITVDLSDGVKINNVNVIIPDVPASNGIIHAVDGVLLPPTVAEALGLGGDTMEEDDAMEEEAAEVGTIVDVAVANGSFTTLVAAVQAADLVDTLNSEGPFTVFAPTDDAFAAALEALDMTAEELLADTDTLTAILTYHVVAGEVLSTDLSDGMMAATVQGEEITVDLSDGVKINGANVVIADVDASNGIIHAIDAVLLPPTVAEALGL